MVHAEVDTNIRLELTCHSRKVCALIIGIKSSKSKEVVIFCALIHNELIGLIFIRIGEGEIQIGTFSGILFYLFVYAEIG